MPRHPILVPLSHDHREALGLTFFLHHPAPPGRVTAMTPTSTPERRRARLLAFYDTYLVSHFRAEEEALFPALRTRRALVASLCDDHRRFAELRDAVAAARGDDAIHATRTSGERSASSSPSSRRASVRPRPGASATPSVRFSLRAIPPAATSRTRT